MNLPGTGRIGTQNYCNDWATGPKGTPRGRLRPVESLLEVGDDDLLHLQHRVRGGQRPLSRQSAGILHARDCDLYSENCTSPVNEIIHRTSKRSTQLPYFSAHSVGCRGISTDPPSDSAPKRRSASSAASASI
jgi:hypothetical protein